VSLTEEENELELKKREAKNQRAQRLQKEEEERKKKEDEKKQDEDGWDVKEDKHDLEIEEIMKIADE